MENMSFSYQKYFPLVKGKEQFFIKKQLFRNYCQAAATRVPINIFNIFHCLTLPSAAIHQVVNSWR